MHTTPQPFQPFVPATETRPELTPRALILGCIFGLLFGAVTVYVGLRAGLTVGASIPISVLSISLLRAFGRASILENNIVQTTGNSGQSIASGVIFTLPALIFLGFDLEYTRIFLLALLGGLLGVLFMIPLRRQLIVEEHGRLAYPEGTACADVLLAGERGGSFAGRVFLGLGLGGLYTFFQNENLFGAWPGTPDYQPQWFKGAAIRADVTPEYLGVGYIIGPRIAGLLFAGGDLLLAGAHANYLLLRLPLSPGDLSRDQADRANVSQRSVGFLCSSYGRRGGRSLRSDHADQDHADHLRRAARCDGEPAPERRGEGTPLRTDDDLPFSVVVGGSVVLVLMMFFFLTFKPVPGAQVSWMANLCRFAAGGFVRVSLCDGFLADCGVDRQFLESCLRDDDRDADGNIGDLSGQGLDGACVRRTGHHHRRRGVHRGGQCGRYIAGSQDRISHRLDSAQAADRVGDWRMRVSTLAIGATLQLMNQGLAEFRQTARPWDIAAVHSGVQVEEQHFHQAQIRVLNGGKLVDTRPGNGYVLLNALNSPELADGKYLFNPQTQQIEVQWIQGIGSEKAAAPQARLMATVVNGILGRKLPWGLVLLGVFLVIAIEILGIRSLSFAVGAYLSIATTLAIFAGGIVRWMIDRAVEKTESESEVSPGSLYASGLIAAGGIVGLIGVALKLYETATGRQDVLLFPANNFLHHDWVSVLMFVLLAGSLYYFARKPLKQ